MKTSIGFVVVMVILCRVATAGDDSSTGSRGVAAESTGSRQIQAKSPDQTAAPHIEGNQVNGRWREGSRLVNQLGNFKLSGEHVTFISTDGKLKLDALENLAVERVARTIGDSPDQLEWSISGVITECRGSNYLLVTQAVLKTKTARPRRTP